MSKLCCIVNPIARCEGCQMRLCKHHVERQTLYGYEDGEQTPEELANSVLSWCRNCLPVRGFQ